MGRKIRVLHTIQNLHYGGMERLFADIVRLLNRGRFESHVLALGFLGRFSEGLEEYATLHVAEPIGKAGLVYPGALIRQVRSIAPDVMHSHTGVWYKTSLAARWAGVPRIVHTEHGRKKPDPLPGRITDGLAARRTDVIVAVSEALRDLLARTVVPDPSRIRVLINGVDTTLYAPRPDNGKLRAELGIGADVPVLGSVGRLEHIKGYDVMVEAYAILRTQWGVGDPMPELVVGGDGSERGALEQSAGRLGVTAGLHLIGWRDDIHDLHRAFDLFTMSSRSEGTSVSLLESMSAGLCPVVTDVGGNAAVLGSGLAHRLVPGQDPAALADAWMEALTNREKSHLDAATARRRVENEFGLERMVYGYQSIYSEG